MPEYDDDRSLRAVPYWPALLDAARLTGAESILELDPDYEDMSVALARRVHHLIAAEQSSLPFHWWRALAQQMGATNISHLNVKANALPLRDRSIDCIVIQFPTFRHADVPRVLLEARRVLRPQGCVLFAAMVLPKEPRQAAFIAAVAKQWNPPSHGEQFIFSLVEWSRLLKKAHFHYQPLTHWGLPLIAGDATRKDKRSSSVSEELFQLLNAASPDLVEAFSIQRYPQWAMLRPCALFGGWVD